MASDRHYMNLALQLARSVQGQTSPNPCVGAVLVNRHEIVGIGAHLKAGEAHAEIHALSMAGERAKGATLYVTLEPCNHFGKTPPCTEAVIKAGVKRVVVAAPDPNPLVRGRGIARLREAGIEVEVGLGREEAERLNEAFNHYIVTRRPYVTLKAAATLDGKIATSTGESQWITGEEARRDVHVLRSKQDAILVGINTVLRDNPRLTARLEGGCRQPVRVILDSSLRIPLDAHVVNTEEAPTWIFTTARAPRQKVLALEQRGVKIFQTGEGPSVNLDLVLTTLGDQGITSLLVEGGGQVNASFLEGGLVHKVVLYLAPKLIGGRESPGPFGGRGFLSLSDSVELKNWQVEQIGRDLKVVGYLK